MSSRKNFIFFNEFDGFDDVPGLFRKCLPTAFDTIPPLVKRSDHTTPILQFGGKASKLEKDNTKALGTGFEDMVVVLLEPSDRENELSIDGFLYDVRPNAIQTVDKALYFAFGTQRDISNTIVLDTRPFSPDRVRKLESESTRNVNDRASYAAFMKGLNMLRPKVILVCQCEWSGKDLGLPRELCSSIRKAGTTKKWTMPNGHQTTIVYGIHPGFYYKQEEGSKHRETAEDLFIASFVVAANQLAGREVWGKGMRQLRELALEATSKRKAQAQAMPKMPLHDSNKLSQVPLAADDDLTALLGKLKIKETVGKVQA